MAGRAEGPSNLRESPHLSPITRTSITDEIVKRVVGLILDEDLKPGSKLPSERELMARLGVGRHSLREAIKALCAVGVVEVSLGEGMFVGAGDSSVLTKPLAWALLIGERSTLEVVEARRMVEVELAGLAAQRGTDEQIAEIGQRLEAMRETLDDPEAFSHHDLEFHEAVGRAANNRVIFQVLETLRHIMRVWIARVHANRQDKWQSYLEHVPIYDAIRSHEVQAARQAAMNNNILAGEMLEATIAGEHP